MGDEQGSEKPDLAGYPNTDELVKAYRSSGDEAKRLKAKVDLLEQQMTQRQPVPQRDSYGRFTRPMNADERLSEMGVPVDALGEYVGQAIERAFAPLAQGLQARTQLVSQYSDYNKYESDVAQFVNSDPDLQARYQRMFQHEPVGAMEYAYLKYGQTKRPTENGQAQNGTRKEAMVPSGRSSEGKQSPSDQDEALARTWERYQKTGDPTAYAKARLRQVIPDEFLNKG
jgi:hypothetical protein